MQHPNTQVAVIIVNLGTPTAPTRKAVRHYLKEFLSDIRVVDAPRLLWFFLLKAILLIRPRTVAKAYQSVWSKDGSPLLAISKQQAKALQQHLNDQPDTLDQPSIHVELAMTYGQPSIEQALESIQQQNIERTLILPLYPQYSSSTTAAVFDKVARLLAHQPRLPELRWINHYHDDPGYIRALADSVRQHWLQHEPSEKLLMSFHGIPKRYTLKGDPYEQHCHSTAKHLAAELGLEDDRWLCTFQSRFGREEWLKPYTDKTLQAWGQQGIQSVDVICPAFSADCLETLEEIKVENKEHFIQAGGQSYHYIDALNDRPEHIEALAKLIQQHTRHWF